MKKILSFLCGLLIFIVVLELSARVYFFSESDRWAGRLEQTPVEIMKNWRGLPFKIPMKDGRLIRYTKKGDVVFDVSFKINNDSTRFSSSNKNQISRDIFFIGCSYTFGTGVRDEETLPSQVAKSSPEYSVLNYGMIGSTPVEALLRLRRVKREEFPRSNNLVIYTYIGDHLRRHTLALPYVADWGKEKEVIRRDGKDFVALGKYRDLFPVKSTVYSLLYRTGIFWSLYPFFDFKFSIVERTDFLTTIELMKEESEKLGGKFLFLIWPGTHSPRWMTEELKDKGIATLDLSRVNLRKLTQTPYIPVDSHPTAEAYKVVSDQLVTFLKKEKF